jgi:hypothetical protein
MEASNRSRWPRDIIVFVLGTIFGLYVVYWFVQALPGPTVFVSVQGGRPTSGESVGCVYYVVFMLTNEPLDYADMKIQLPNRITNYKVGFGLEAIAPDETFGMQAWNLGRDRGDECAVLHALANREENLQVSEAGDMISMHGSKIRANTPILGIIATVANDSALKPPSKHFEGSYEYTKLGQSVRKSLQFVDRGVQDIVPK